MDYFATDKIIEPEKGDLLISEPYLPDPNFERTVILVCEHDETNGTFGYILNRPSFSLFDEVVEEVDGFHAQLFVGGPVQQDSLHFIHRSPTQFPESNEVGSGIYWGGNYDRLLTLINTKQIDKDDFRFLVGYSGWSPGQLMDELKVKSWIVYKNVNAKMVFDTPVGVLWKQVLNAMGGKFKVIANYPTDPRLN